MMTSTEWTTLRILEHELSILEVYDKKPRVRKWMEKRIKELKDKDEQKG
jgi:hypothetical protein